MFAPSAADFSNNPGESRNSSVTTGEQSRASEPHPSKSETWELQNQDCAATTLSCGGFAVRFAIQGKRVTLLEIDVTHPAFPGVTRVLPLSQVLNEAYALSPETVAQIVHENSSDEMRLDALEVIVSHISPDLRRTLGWRDVGVTERKPSSEIRDEFEPTFAISQRLATQYNDLVDGRARRVVTVWRNDEPFVEFCVVQDLRGDVFSADMNVVRLELNWPLVNKNGLSVNKFDVWRSIDEYIDVLQRSRLYPWPAALEELAGEHERRLSANRTRGESPEYCVEEVLLAVNENDLPVVGSGKALKRFFATVNDVGCVTHTLPDGRTLWMSMPGVSQYSESPSLQLAGFSCGADPFILRISFDTKDHQAVFAAWACCNSANDWNDIDKGLKKLALIPSGRLSIIEPRGPEECPLIINQLVECAKRYDAHGGSNIGTFGESEMSDSATRFFVSRGIVRGCGYMHAFADYANLSQAWLCDALVNENVEGHLSFTNKLGGRFVVAIDADRGDVSSRSEALRGLIQCMYERPENLLLKAREIGAIELCDDFLPTAANASSYRTLNDLAVTWLSRFSNWESAHRLRYSRQQPFRVRPLPEARWAISRCLDGVSPSALSYHTLIVGERGVEQAYYSDGKRTFFGSLKGVRVVPASPHSTFSDEEVLALLSIMQNLQSHVEDGDVERLLSHHLLEAAVHRGASMRHIDPDCDTKDLWVRARNLAGWIIRQFTREE